MKFNLCALPVELVHLIWTYMSPAHQRVFLGCSNATAECATPSWRSAYPPTATLKVPSKGCLRALSRQALAALKTGCWSMELTGNTVINYDMYDPPYADQDGGVYHSSRKSIHFDLCMEIDAMCVRERLPCISVNTHEAEDEIDIVRLVSFSDSVTHAHINACTFAPVALAKNLTHLSLAWYGYDVLPAIPTLKSLRVESMYDFRSEEQPALREFCYTTYHTHHGEGDYFDGLPSAPELRTLWLELARWDYVSWRFRSEYPKLEALSLVDEHHNSFECETVDCSDMDGISAVSIVAPAACVDVYGLRNARCVQLKCKSLLDSEFLDGVDTVILRSEDGYEFRSPRRVLVSVGKATFWDFVAIGDMLDAGATVVYVYSEGFSLKTLEKRKDAKGNLFLFQCPPDDRGDAAARVLKEAGFNLPRGLAAAYLSEGKVSLRTIFY